MCFDGVKRLCHIRGKLRKKVWINQSDIILVGLRDYHDAKADVILKYSPEEAKTLSHTVNFQKLSKSTRPLPLAKKAMMTTLSSTMLTLLKRRMTSTLAELTTSKNTITTIPILLP